MKLALVLMLPVVGMVGCHEPVIQPVPDTPLSCAKQIMANNFDLDAYCNGAAEVLAKEWLLENPSYLEPEKPLVINQTATPGSSCTNIIAPAGSNVECKP